MNTVRSCFAAIVSFLVFAIGWWAADSVVCCNSSSVASGGGVASCQNENRTFHTVEAIGDGTCDDNRTAVPVRKCCPPNRPYDPEVRFCGPAGADGDEYLRRMMHRLRDGFQAVADAMMVGYDYEKPLCDPTYVLVDVPALEVRGLMEADPSAVELPSGYCFDLTPSDELVARTCRPRDQYCGRGRYTCVNKCYESDQMIIIGDDKMWCEQRDKPFTMSSYETDADGRPVGQSNSTVLPYISQHKCDYVYVVTSGFMLTTDGSLYLNGNGRRVPCTGYCVDHYAVDGSRGDAGLLAIVCESDTLGRWKNLFIRAGSIASAVCLALTLFVYSTLPTLQNIQNYYVKCYVGNLFMSFICVMVKENTEYIKGETCVLVGYFTLFVFLTTCCWLNVICFDIYWMLRYNNSVNRNTSISVRAIMYHIYCWGFPSVCVSTGCYFQYSQNETLLKLSPNIGNPDCWIKHLTDYGGIIFFLLPVSVMLTANLILFLLTNIYCSRIKSEINKFKKTDSKTESFFFYKEKFVMSIKLYLIMGVPYFLSSLSILLHINGIIWYIMEAASSLQGVFIFIILVAKRKIITDIRKKFRGFMHHSESKQINTITGSS